MRQAHRRPLATFPGIPEKSLFVFVKMAAGMYLEHYLDSKYIVIVDYK